MLPSKQFNHHLTETDIFEPEYGLDERVDEAADSDEDGGGDDASVYDDSEERVGNTAWCSCGMCNAGVSAHHIHLKTIIASKKDSLKSTLYHSEVAMTTTPQNWQLNTSL